MPLSLNALSLKETLILSLYVAIVVVFFFSFL